MLAISDQLYENNIACSMYHKKLPIIVISILKVYIYIFNFGTNNTHNDLFGPYPLRSWNLSNSSVIDVIFSRPRI